jgi:hypothetical protein
MPITRLDPAARAKVLGALILLTIGGVALVTLAWLALRVGRRQVRRVDDVLARRQQAPVADDWAQKRLTANAADAPGQDGLGRDKGNRTGDTDDGTG